MSRSPSSPRWCPTAEQLVILRELYARGLTNPNAFQIKTITAQLSNYGKIQGRNVFYWFQNHKARERQRLRKKHYVVVKQQRLMQQYQINPSSAFLQLFTTSYSPKYLYPQVVQFLFLFLFSFFWQKKYSQYVILFQNCQSSYSTSQFLIPSRFKTSIESNYYIL